MKRKEIKDLLIAVNSTENFFKFPVGNRDLSDKLKSLEESGKIKFNGLTNKWELV